MNEKLHLIRRYVSCAFSLLLFGILLLLSGILITAAAFSSTMHIMGPVFIITGTILVAANVVVVCFAKRKYRDALLQNRRTIARHLSHDSTVDYQYPNQRVQYPEHTLVPYPPPYTVQPTVPASTSTIPMQSHFTADAQVVSEMDDLRRISLPPSYEQCVLQDNAAKLNLAMP